MRWFVYEHNLSQSFNWYVQNVRNLHHHETFWPKMYIFHDFWVNLGSRVTFLSMSLSRSLCHSQNFTLFLSNNISWFFYWSICYICPPIGKGWHFFSSFFCTVLRKCFFPVSWNMTIVFRNPSSHSQSVTINLCWNLNVPVVLLCHPQAGSDRPGDLCSVWTLH